MFEIKYAPCTQYCTFLVAECTHFETYQCVYDFPKFWKSLYSDKHKNKLAGVPFLGSLHTAADAQNITLISKTGADIQMSFKTLSICIGALSYNNTNTLCLGSIVN